MDRNRCAFDSVLRCFRRDARPSHGSDLCRVFHDRPSASYSERRSNGARACLGSDRDVVGRLDPWRAARHHFNLRAKAKENCRLLVRPIAFLLLGAAMAATLAGVVGYIAATLGWVPLTGDLTNEVPQDNHIF